MSRRIRDKKFNGPSTFKSESILAPVNESMTESILSESVAVSSSDENSWEELKNDVITFKANPPPFESNDH